MRKKMFKLFYVKLGLINIKRNKELFLPYILTWIITISMFYMMGAITFSTNLSSIGGGEEMRQILVFGLYVIGIFAIIFLFYTNSFIAKRRKKEISLYNVLGFNKRQIALVLFIEGLIITLFTLLVGICLGYVFGKGIFYLLTLLLKSVSSFDLKFSFIALLVTLVLFGFIFFIILIYNTMQIVINDPIALFTQQKAGEKQPRSKLIITIIGFVSLITGYLIAMMIEDPIIALGMFFIAVLLVMIGTYALFTSGSITILNGLRSNQKFYYQSHHFPVISGMIYRLKQNAIGLANICILSTMVLVTISTTVSLYAGQEQALNKQYPYDVVLTTNSQTDQYNNTVLKEVYELSDQTQTELNDFVAFEYLNVWAGYQDNYFKSDYDENANKYALITFVLLEQYNVIHDQNMTLDDNEILFYDPSNTYQYDHIIYNDHDMKIKTKLNDINIKGIDNALISSVDNYLIVIKDKQSLLIVTDNDISSLLDYKIAFNLSGENENIQTFNEGLYNVGDNQTRLSGKNVIKESFYGLYGGLLFIGIFLGSLFLIATALIIYYKQVSEGYDDKQRYLILKNVGMSDEETKASINYQIKMVFFLPLLFAIIHIGFAFKMITKMLALFGLSDIKLFLICTVITVLIFILIYRIIYTLTARIYYRIIA